MSPELQGKNLSVKISTKALKILDDIASQADVSRQKLVNGMLELTIEELEFGNRIGFFQMIVLAKKVLRKLNLSTEEMEGKDEKIIPVRLSREYLARLDALAAQADRTRHYLMKKFIEVGADELDKIYNKKILVPHGLMMRKLKDRMKSLCDEGEKYFERIPAELD